MTIRFSVTYRERDTGKVKVCIVKALSVYSARIIASGNGEIVTIRPQPARNQVRR